MDKWKKIKKKEEKSEEQSEEKESKVFKKTFSKKVKRTGLPIEFGDRKAQIDAQVRFKPKVAEDFLILNPQHKRIQNSQIFNESSSQTPIIAFKEHGMNHVEGGWPKEMDLNEASQVNRYALYYITRHYERNPINSLGSSKRSRRMNSLSKVSLISQSRRIEKFVRMLL